MDVLFDLNGTLTDPAPIGAPWADPQLGLDVLGLAVRGGMVDAILGNWRPFPEHLRSALEGVVARRGLDPDGIPAAMDAAGSLPAWPEAAAALTLLRDAGHRISVLTNSGARAGRATLDACGLLLLVDDVFGVDAVRSFKPHPRCYEHALKALGLPRPQDTVMVAAHAWDLAGAEHAGMRTAWVARGEVAYPTVFPAPDVEGDDLLAVARGLLGTG